MDKKSKSLELDLEIAEDGTPIYTLSDGRTYEDFGCSLRAARFMEHFLFDTKGGKSTAYGMMKGWYDLKKGWKNETSRKKASKYYIHMFKGLKAQIYLKALKEDMRSICRYDKNDKLDILEEAIQQCRDENNVKDLPKIMDLHNKMVGDYDNTENLNVTVEYEVGLE